VRELENVVQRAIVLSGDGVISANHLVFDEPADHELYIGEPSGMPASLMNPSYTPSYAGASSAMQGAANNVHPLDSGYGQRDRWRDTQVAPTNPFSAHMAAQSGFESLPEETSDSTTGLQGAMDANEFRIIVDTIKNTRTRQEAADMLGISQRTLRYKIARMRERGIQIPKRRSA
jgi:two-component system response regulator FlrC